MKVCDETQYREGKGVASTDKVTSRRRIITPTRIPVLIPTTSGRGDSAWKRF